jgi:hypothetical protein
LDGSWLKIAYIHAVSGVGREVQRPAKAVGADMIQGKALLKT